MGEVIGQEQRVRVTLRGVPLEGKIDSAKWNWSECISVNIFKNSLRNNNDWTAQNMGKYKDMNLLETFEVNEVFIKRLTSNGTLKS